MSPADYPVHLGLKVKGPKREGTTLENVPNEIFGLWNNIPDFLLLFSLIPYRILSRIDHC